MRINRLSFADALFLGGAIAFSVGCIASVNQTARTVEPGRVSIAASYMKVNSTEDPDDDPLQLVTTDFRVGLAKGVDFGLLHTYDATEGNDNSYNTLWGDMKLQITNRNNELWYPALSLGLLKGYAYHDRVKDHFTGIPLIFSMRLSNTATATAFYRQEYVSDEFIPDEFKNPRKTYGFNMEVALVDETRGMWTPKLNIGVGTFNSLTGGCGDSGVIISAGLTLYSPLR